MDMLNLAGMLKSLLNIYGTLAIFAGISAVLRRHWKNHPRTYIISDPTGHSIKVTLDSHLAPEERERILVQKINELAKAA